MKHYKEGRNHIFEFGEMSITRIKLKQSQYEELVNYFTQQQVKNLNIPAVIKSVCDICGKPVHDNYSLCFEHLVMNERDRKQTVL